MENIKIRCPKCAWQPGSNARWMCSCTHVWNTFDTAGRCPACGKIHKDTQCLKCKKWSPHLDWYEGLDGIIEQLKKEILESWEVPAGTEG